MTISQNCTANVVWVHVWRLRQAQWQSWKTDSELELPGARETLTAILVLTHQSCCLELLIDSWMSLLEKAEVVFCVWFLLLCAVVLCQVSFTIFTFIFCVLSPTIAFPWPVAHPVLWSLKNQSFIDFKGRRMSWGSQPLRNTWTLNFHLYLNQPLS